MKLTLKFQILPILSYFLITCLSLSILSLEHISIIASIPNKLLSKSYEKNGKWDVFVSSSSTQKRQLR